MALFKVTQTMLDKSIQDANKDICKFLLDNNFIDYNELTKKVYLPCKLQVAVGSPRKPSRISCYKTTRGDKRIWIKGLKDISKAGDILNLKINNKEIIVHNLTK